MSKFKDTTKGGYPILWREEIKEGERKGWSFGLVDTKESEDPCLWTPDGIDTVSVPYNLIPAEPEIMFSECRLLEPKRGSRYICIRIDYYTNDTYTVTKEEI